MTSLVLAVFLRADPVPVVTVPRFTHPGAGQTIYCVLTDRFANGSTVNDTGGLTGEGDEHGFDPMRITHFHGGDFTGLTARLDYLENLGVTAIWVTPPFRNQPVRDKGGKIGIMAAHHGYWILDFLHVDPHLGTDDEFRNFIHKAHARGIKVFMDIVVNHTADVIHYGRDSAYRDTRVEPYRDAFGRPFDIRAEAYNGVNDPAGFPELSLERSFPLQPVVPAGMQLAKNPSWLNDLTLYHNRGDKTEVAPESELFGDFRGADGLMTEHPRVVQGFIEIFQHWMEDFGVDGFRIDTARHVNAEFWQAFNPAMRARAREIGRPEFFQFGEVANEAGGAAFLSEFSTGIPMDSTLDFGFFAAARKFIVQQGSAVELAEFFTTDDFYTDHDSNVHSTTTFLGNHDAGRFAYFVQQGNPDASWPQIADLVRLGYGLLYLSRGQPVVYYGDEQGMIGRGGDHERARESMFAARAPLYRDATLLATNRTGADDKFDEAHPFYRLFRDLGALRAAHAALRSGAMIPRATQEPGLFAFSRIERRERIEYLVALNNSRSDKLTSRVATCQQPGTLMHPIFDSRSDAGGDSEILVTNASGEVTFTLAPMQFVVWRANSTLPKPAVVPQVDFLAPQNETTLEFVAHEADGHLFGNRHELRAEVTGGDGFAEVTFAMVRSSRPGQFELVGTDDAAPYRVFWCPPPDLAPGEELSFIASVSDLRGHRASSRVERIKVAPSGSTCGIRGATVPLITTAPPPVLRLAPNHAHALVVHASGTSPLEFQWLRDDTEIPEANNSVLIVSEAGRYTVAVRNRAGTTISPATIVTVEP